MRPARRKPLVGIPASVRYMEGGLAFHGNGQQYHDVVTKHVDAHVFTIPSLVKPTNALGLLDLVDGLLLTGGTSNVHPSAYGCEEKTNEGFYDHLRDRNSIALVREAVARGLPVFGICRGLQELNVAFGGTLHQEHHLEPGMQDHRSDPSLPLAEQFRRAHEITITPGGIIAGLYAHSKVMVNSSHMQGIDRVADNLRVEAIADDGTVEIVSVADARGFALAVQFHPEWYTDKEPFYMALFQAFRESVHGYARSR